MANYNSLGAAFGSALGGYISSTVSDTCTISQGIPGSIFAVDSTQIQMKPYTYYYQPQQLGIGLGSAFDSIAKVAIASRSILDNLRLEISNWCDGVLKV